MWSGRKDLNLRPPAPKAGALTRLRYAPKNKKMVELRGFEPLTSSVRGKRAPSCATAPTVQRRYCNEGDHACQGALLQPTMQSWKEVCALKFGPELVHAWELAIRKRFCDRQSTKVETGVDWLAVRFSSDEWLFFSWSSEGSGCCCMDEKSLKPFMREKKRLSLQESFKAHISGARLRDVNQIGKDRVLHLRFEKTIGAGFIRSYSLFFESLDRFANLVLCDERSVIIDAAKILSPGTRDRTIFPSFVYAPPPPVREGDNVDGMLSPEKVERLAGFGKALRVAVIREWDSRTPDEWSRAFRDTYSGQEPSLILQNSGGKLVSFPVLLKDAAPVQGLDALDASFPFLCAPIEKCILNRVTKQIRALLDREKHRKQRVLDGMIHREELVRDAPGFKRSGDAILANMQLLHKGMDVAHVPYWDENGAETRLSIPLDPMKSPQENASDYYARYARAKGDPARVAQSIDDIRESLYELDEQLALLDTIDSSQLLEMALQDLRSWLSPKSGAHGKQKRKKTKETPAVRRIEYAGTRISVGLSALGNRSVTFTEGISSDLWLHARDVPGSHVMLRGLPVGEGEEAIRIAASLAAYYSKAKASGPVQVIVTERKYVRPIPGTIAHVRYRNERTVLTSPLYWKEVLGDLR